MIADVFLDIPHELAEGPLWHGERGKLFWCAVLAGELNACDAADDAFWISPMGRNAGPAAGSLYRFADGALAIKPRGMTIPNATCPGP